MARRDSGGAARGLPDGGGAGREATDLLHGPLLGKVVRFAIPLAVTYIVEALFTTVDSLVLGAFVSKDALAAVGDVAPISSLLLGLVTGLSIGLNVDVAEGIGSHDGPRVRAAVQGAVPLSLAIGTALGVAGMLATGPLLSLIATPGSVMGPARTYLLVYSAGMPAFGAYNFASAALRADGDSRSPLVALLAGCLTNLALDLALGVWARLGVAGVACATVVAMAVASAVAVAALARTRGAVRLDLRRMRVSRPSMATVMRIGLPAGLQSAIFAVSNIVLQDAINGFGADAMAGCMASLNYKYLCYYMVTAFAQTCVTFTGQNYAARDYGRCRRIFALCMALGALSSAAFSLATLAFARPLLELFSTSPDVVAYGLQRVRIVAALDFLAFLYEVPAGALRGMGWSLMPAVIIVLGSCGLRVAWVLTVFRALGSFESLMAVYPVSWVATGAALLLAYAWVARTALRPGARSQAYA